MLRRTFAHNGQSVPEERRYGASMVSSKLTSGEHAPAIDIDGIPVHVVRSRSGNSHLYIDHAISWRKYRKLLKALTEAGIVERGYYRSAVRRKATLLRLPKPQHQPVLQLLKATLGRGSHVYRDVEQALIPGSADPDDVRYRNTDVGWSVSPY